MDRWCTRERTTCTSSAIRNSVTSATRKPTIAFAIVTIDLASLVSAFHPGRVRVPATHALDFNPNLGSEADSEFWKIESPGKLFLEENCVAGTNPAVNSVRSQLLRRTSFPPCPYGNGCRQPTCTGTDQRPEHSPGFADLAIKATVGSRDQTMVARNLRHYAQIDVRAINPFESLTD